MGKTVLTPNFSIKMSHQVAGKSRGKPPAKPPAQLHYKEHEPPELYEEVEMHQEESLESEGRYATTGPHDPPNHYVETSRVTTAAVKTQESTDTAIYKPTKSKVFLIALAATLIICLLVVSLVAVILYSPQVRTSSESAADLLSRIEQLERRVEQLQAIQGTNSTLATLTSLQESQESMETSISRLSTSVNSQINSIQSLSLQNLREDLDRLRSVDLYQNCIRDTRTCTMSTGSSNYYLSSCSTPGLNANPQVRIIITYLHILLMAFARCYAVARALSNKSIGY